jgi:chloride channel protein, CIC family
MRRAVLYAVASVVVGALGAGFAIAFRLALHHGLRIVTGSANVLAGFAALPPSLRLLLPAAGGAAAGAVALLSLYSAGGHGMANVLESVVLGRGAIRLAPVLLRSVASLFALCTGGSIGREGPIIQFGAGSGSTVGRWLGLTDKQIRMLVAAGAGAGFAAAYNTPIAAMLFVVEVVTGVLGVDVVVPAAIATAVSTTLTRVALGGGPLYGTREFALVTQQELVAHCALGVAAGLAAPAFLATLSAAERAVRRWAVPRVVRGAVGGLVVGALALRLPEVTGNGYEAIQLVLDAKLAGGILAILLVAKAAATISSVSSGSPGGVFTPSMFLGAALGGLVGSAVPHVFATRASAAEAGGYALAGMAAMVAGTTHAPVMAVALGFELSGDYSLVVPMILGTALASALSRALRPDSVYTAELRNTGLPWRGSVTERLARAVAARDILTMDPLRVEANAPIGDALALLLRPNVRVVYVETDPLRVVDLHEAKRLWASPPPPAGMRACDVAHVVETVRPEETLLDLSEKLWSADWGEVPVVDGSRLLGVVTRRALLGALDREVLHRDVLLTRVVRFEGEAEAHDYLELPRGHRVEEVATPGWLSGRPLDDTEIRSRFGVVVIGVRPAASGSIEEVCPGRPLSPLDRLVVVGPPEGIDRFRS